MGMIRGARIPAFFLSAAILITVPRAFPGPKPGPGYKRWLYSVTQTRTAYIHVYDIDDGHRKVKDIPIPHSDYARGICACAATGRLYYSFWFDSNSGQQYHILCLDIARDSVLWDRAYDGDVDRLDVTPDGKTLYAPCGEGSYLNFWRVLDAATGAQVGTIHIDTRGTHNTLVSLDGARAYLGSVASPYLWVADTRTNAIVGKVGPFSTPVRPFTVNGRQSLCFVNQNDLNGFEVGDIATGRKLYRAEAKRPPGTDSSATGFHTFHGIALSPDEREVWTVDEPAKALHVFDVSRLPDSAPVQVATVPLRRDVQDTPGWIAMSMDGAYVYPSTGDVIDRKSRAIVAGIDGYCEKLVELHFRDGELVEAGKQFAVGRVLPGDAVAVPRARRAGANGGPGYRADGARVPDGARIAAPAFRRARAADKP